VPKLGQFSSDIMKVKIQKNTGTIYITKRCVQLLARAEESEAAVLHPPV